jgi:DNA repair exonuclease SbcCD ATPase subunit
MLEVLKQLFENNVVSEDIKAEIEESWNKRIQENRDHVTAELREEFARKFEHEKSIMVESLDRMLSERLSTEISEFVEDRKQLIEAKATYAKKMKKDSAMMKEFVFRSLGNELSELHEDHKRMSSNFAKLEEFVVTQLAREISEFHIDKKDVVETKVALVREAKAQLDAVKSNFIKRSAKMVEETVVKTLKTEMHQLREDISSARENDFGRRLFEAFASEYTHSYLNEKSEVKKVIAVLHQREQELAEAYSHINQTSQLVESKENEIARMRDLTQRKEIISELLSPLGRDKKDVMASLLESVATPKLRSAYDKYLPSVLNEGTSTTKQALTESKAVTGNKQVETFDAATSNIIDIRRLAGLK